MIKCRKKLRREKKIKYHEYMIFFASVTTLKIFVYFNILSFLEESKKEGVDILHTHFLSSPE